MISINLNGQGPRASFCHKFPQYNPATDARKLLGIGDAPTPQEIRRGDRVKSQKHHPDKDGDSWAFQQVKDSFDELSNPAKSENPFEIIKRSKTPEAKSNNDLKGK